MRAAVMHAPHGHCILEQNPAAGEATLFAVSCATEDKAEGTKAFLEKRAANFKGK